MFETGHRMDCRIAADLVVRLGIYEGRVLVKCDRDHEMVVVVGELW